MTKWTSEACRDLREDKEFFTKLLEKTGLLMTVDGSGDEKGLCLLTQSFALLVILAASKPSTILCFLAFFGPYVKNLHPDCGIYLIE